MTPTVGGGRSGGSTRDGFSRSDVAWIGWIDESAVTGPLAVLYRRYAGPTGLDHILKIHSLNPESMRGHYELYRHLMRGPSGLSRAEREMIAVAVSAENECFY